MSRQLWLLRHAKSDWNNANLSDFERPLNQRGTRDAPRLGRWLRQQGLCPDYLVSSPAERAHQTALSVAGELGIAAERIMLNPRIYEATTSHLLGVLAACPAEVQKVLLVGHNPGLETLLLYLCGQLIMPDDGKWLPTCTLARLEMPDDWQQLAPASARLLSITRPRTLPE